MTKPAAALAPAGIATERKSRSRSLKIFCMSALTLLGSCWMAGESRHAIAATLGGPLQLADEGSFFVGGKKLTIKAPFYGATGLSGPGEITVDQMYVNYRIPVNATGLPVIMVHGSNHTGMTFETTPDGREGWATYFVRKGHPVYVVDHVGRGRSGFNPTPISDAIQQSNPSLTKIAPLYPQQAAWVNFRIGKAYPEPFAGTQFPIEKFDDYLAQLVPNAEELANGPTGEATISALGLLLDKVGPAILIVHSQSGLYGMEVVRRKTARIKGFVSVEGGCAPLPAGTIEALAKVPFVSVFGDNSVGAVGVNGDGRRNACNDTVKAAQKAGGDATFYLLPEHGIKGNTHMMMMDKNNLQIADILLSWIDKSADPKTR
jgi:pimeloyl-ACP methyl ester carboxylesterase